MGAAPSSSSQALAVLVPSRLDASVRERVGPLLVILSQLRRRVWANEAAQRGVWSLSLGLPVAALAVFALRLGCLPSDWDLSSSVVALLALFALMVWTVAHRLRWMEAARHLDRLASAHDRLATALELAAAGRQDAWARLQAREAGVFVRRLVLAGLLPLRRPRGLGWLIGGGLLLSLSLNLPLGSLEALLSTAPPMRGLRLRLPLEPGGFVSVDQLLGADALELIEADAELLRDVESQLGDDRAKAWVKQVRRVLEAVHRGEVDKVDALARLDQLERQRPPIADPFDAPPRADQGAQAGAAGAKFGAAGANSGEAAAKGRAAGGRSDAQAQARAAGADRAMRDAVTEALGESLGAAPGGALRSALERAVESKSLDGVAKWLEKLAKEDMSDKELKKWIKVAERFAGKLADREVPKRFEKLASRVRRLQERRDQKGGLTAADRTRLRKARQSMEQLRRDHGDPAAARYRLRRLERAARGAVDELRRARHSRLAPPKDGSKESRAQRLARRRRQVGKRFREQMRQAAGQLRREGQGQRRRQATRIAEGRMRDLRKTLSRSGTRDQAQKNYERRARAQKEAKRRAAQGRREAGADDAKRGRSGRQEGKKNAQDQRAKGERRAAGQRGQGQRGRGQRGQGQRARGTKLGQGDMGSETRMRMLGQGARGGSEAGGSQAGSEAGGPNQGRRHAMKVQRTEKVRGVQGEGPSTKRVFMEAARRGFVRAAWRAVYADYSDVAQEMLDKESLPPGRRALVRRYYELIRPRDLQ